LSHALQAAAELAATGLVSTGLASTGLASTGLAAGTAGAGLARDGGGGGQGTPPGGVQGGGEGRAAESPAITQAPSEPVIRVLPPLVASQIAAGEVVERPASIVKELVENAIDAGATRIRVDIERGGIELVRVSDDGCGMAPEQLALAVTPSATSKLRSPQDLLHIGTLGFRGEALASIASVSRCTIRSRRGRMDAHAHELRAFGSVTNLEPPSPVAGSPGTTISAANLFFNVPARRAFLRTVQTERDRCLEVVDHAALAHPGIAFVATSDGQTIRDYPPAAGPASRILAVLGEELASQLFSIVASTDDLTELARAGASQGSRQLANQAGVRAPVATLFGVAGLPAIARGTMKGQHIFVNGRPIKDRAIQHAIAEAYRGLIEPGRYPTVVLLIEIDPTLVDVNVHPQKSEVRFRDGGLLHSLVLRALREGLAKADLTPRAADLGSSTLRDGQVRAGRLGASDGRGVFGSAGGGFRHIAWAPAASPTSSAPASFGAAQQHAEGHLARRDGTLLGAAAPLATGLARGAGAGINPAGKGPAETGPAGIVPAPMGTLADSKLAEFFATRYVPGDPLPSSLAAGLSGGEGQKAGLPAAAILQVHDKYVVTLDEAGLVIIDQHALHERVMFEKLLARIASGPLESQPLLTPIVVPSTRDAVSLLEGLGPLLARLGLALGALGPATIGVQSAPTLLIERGVDLGAFASDLLEKALRGELGSFRESSDRVGGNARETGQHDGQGDALRPQHEHALRDVLDMMACKAAIKAGDRLSEGELRELLRLRESVERSSNCPHGRPTSMRVTLRELDRLFGRS
jgi:DNA mismatch repair protein MutL